MIPTHRHNDTSETAIVRGRAVQWLYDEQGNVTEKVLLVPMGAGCPVEPGMTKSDRGVPAMQVEKGQWHRLECLESGTVILEFKDGPYEPIGEGDILTM